MGLSYTMTCPNKNPVTLLCHFLAITRNTCMPVTPRQYFHILNMKYSEMNSTERRLALKCCHDNTIF